MSRAVSVVLFHNVAEEETDLVRGLEVTTYTDVFRRQIEWLSAHYNVVSLDQVLEGRLPRAPLLITFDDFYRSVLDAVQDVLRPRSLPSVFFVNPNLVDTDDLSLDNVLAWCAAEHGLDALREAVGADREAAPDLGALIGNVMSRMGSEARLALKKDLSRRFGLDLRKTGLPSPSITAGDLTALRACGVEIGNHTANHVHCRALSRDELPLEIVESKRKLEALSGQPVRAFAVPYGSEQDLTPPVLDALRGSGHEAIFLVHGRSNRFRPASDIWYRVSLRNETPLQLRMKLSVLPALRSGRQKIRQVFS